MPGRCAGRADAVIAVCAGAVAVYVVVRVVRWAVREVARLAVDVWHAAPWIGLGAVGAVVLVAAVTGDRRARQRADVEHVDHPARPDEAVEHVEQTRPAVTIEQAPGSCPYGPICPRCTGTGTIGGTALDHPPAVDPDTRPAVDPVPLRPARRGRGRPRKVA